MAIVIVPYTAFGPLKFGKTTKQDCITLLGEPLEERASRMGVEEFVYEQCVVRFDRKTATVHECTLLPYTEAWVNGIAVTWDRTFLRLVCEQDQSPRDVYGFIVLVRLGIAVTGVHDADDGQLALTAFSRGAFDDMLPESTPFVMP